LFAERFVPRFSSYSFVLSRQCEYEADADGASITSAEICAQALTHVAVFARLWESGFRKEVNRWRLADAQPPIDFAERFTQRARQWPVEELNYWLDQALSAPPSWIDTHPRLPQRVGALAQKPSLSTIQEPCAGEALFGAAWSGIVQGFNQRWLSRVRPKWLFYHLHRKEVLQPLLDMPPAQIVNLPLKQQLLRAEGLIDDHPDQAEAEFESLIERHPIDAEVSFSAGFALSERSPDKAVASMKRAGTLAPSYRMHVYRALCDHFEWRGDGAEADKYAALLDRSIKHCNRAYEKFEDVLVKCDVVVSVLDTTGRSLLSRVAQEDACITALWLFTREISVPMKNSDGQEQPVIYPMHCAIAIVDPEIMRQSGWNDDDVTDRYAGYLHTLLPYNAPVMCRPVFTTENTPQWLAGLMSKFPETCCFRRA
jgi:hypothetical protein